VAVKSKLVDYRQAHAPKVNPHLGCTITEWAQSTITEWAGNPLGGAICVVVGVSIFDIGRSPLENAVPVNIRCLFSFLIPMEGSIPLAGVNVKPRILRIDSCVR
jgi:hypothetical protein